MGILTISYMHSHRLAENLFMGIYLNYPKQVMRAIKLESYNLGTQSNKYKTKFVINNMEVIKRRNTRTKPCNEAYKQDDDVILQRLANSCK